MNVKIPVVLCSFLLLLFSCDFFKQDEKNDFYKYNKGWDTYRIPLIKPYQLIKSPGSEWGLDFKDTNLFPLAIKKFNIVSNVIYGYGSDGTAYKKGKKMDYTRYFIIDVQKNKELNFRSEAEYIMQAGLYKVEPSILYKPDSLYKVLVESKKLWWFPVEK